MNCQHNRESAEPKDAAQDAAERWEKRNKASAVMVRPDRYVFGTGDPEVLRKAYERTVLTSSAA